MKKTVWIVNEYNGVEGTCTRQIHLARYLTQAGYDVYLFSGSAAQKGGENYIRSRRRFEYRETGSAKGYIVRTSDYSGSVSRVLASLQFQSRLWRYRDSFPTPDVIVSDFAGLFGNVFLKWKKRYATRIIYDILDFWPEGFVELGYIKKDSIPAKILYGMEHRSYAEADGIIFSVQGGRDYLADKGWSRDVGGDVDAGNVGYLNNGVDLETVDRQRTENVLDDHDLDTDAFKVIYLGSISEFNGLDVLVEAARVLQERKADGIKLLIYGYGNREEALKRLAGDYGLKNVVFKGKLDVRYAMNLLSRGDLNVLSFRDTPLLKYGVSPNKLFMYFASGRPVLSTIRPGYDLIEARQAGISTENDPAVVADAILRFSRMERDVYDGYCRRARELAEEYDYKKLVNVLIDQIEGA